MPTSPWHVPLYRRLWFNTVLISLANQFERIAVGWLVLVETDSVFLTAASFAIHKAPASLSAPVAGHLSDLLPRERMLAMTAFYKSIILVALGMVALGDYHSMWPIFTLMVLSGLGMSFETPATQGLITDIVPRELAMRAVAMQSTGARAIGAMGSLGGGVLIAAFGIPETLFVGGTVFIVAGWAMYMMPAPDRVRHAPLPPASDILKQSLAGLAILMRLPVVRTLLITAFVVEMFAFAYGSIMPSLARDVLRVASDGLGTLNMMSGLGAVVGVALLTAFGDGLPRGKLMIGVTLLFGGALMVFGSSDRFLLSLVLVAGVGAMAAAFDALQWTLLQQHAPDDMRGRAIGGWMFVVGFGWMGQLALGAAAESFGVQWALIGSGCMVVLTGLGAVILSPQLRKA